MVYGPFIIKKTCIGCGLTGIAAKAIAGRTLHNAFSLPIEKFGLGKYKPGVGDLFELLIKRKY